MKVMMFCVFWHKTTSTEIWWNREKRKIVDLTPLIDTISFNNLNIVKPKNLLNCTKHNSGIKFKKRFVFPHSSLNNSSKEYFQDCD